MKEYEVGNNIKFKDEITGDIMEGTIHYVYPNNTRYDVNITGYLGTINVMADNMVEEVPETLHNELSKLQRDIEIHGKYLEDYTYESFRDVQEFASRLRHIITKYYGDNDY